MKKWMLAAVAASMSLCVVACDHGGSSSSEDDMTIPEKLNFVEPTPSKDSAATDRDVNQFEDWFKDSNIKLDLFEAVKNITRTAETEADKEKEYQDSWGKQSDLTKSLATLITTQIASKDCILNKVPAKETKVEDFKVGAAVLSKEAIDLTGSKCAVNSHTVSNGTTLVKSIQTENGVPVEYSAYGRIQSHEESKVLDSSFPSASYVADFTYAGPIKYKADTFMDMYWTGTYKVNGTDDGKSKGNMDCTMQILFKNLGLLSSPAQDYQYIFHCMVTKDGKSIPLDMNYSIDKKKNVKYDVYVAGRKLDLSAWLNLASLKDKANAPKPPTSDAGKQ